MGKWAKLPTGPRTARRVAVLLELDTTERLAWLRNRRLWEALLADYEKHLQVVQVQANVIRGVARRSSKRGAAE